MTKDDEPDSWFARLKQFLHVEPQNQEDLVGLLRDAESRALITPETLTMLEGAIAFSQMRVRDIMLPKKQMICLSEQDSFASITACVSQSGHSRFPVISASGDEVIGILHAKDLLPFGLGQEDRFDLLDISRQATFVPESKRLDGLLSEFRQTRNHMAIVVDEYGAIAGFVTIEDIIEQIIGDIEDEFDIDEEAYIKLHSDSHFIVKAHMPIEDFNEQLKTAFSDTVYDTIGGIVMASFGHLPKRGESITIEHLEFKVINADARRIKLLECIDTRQKDIM